MASTQRKERPTLVPTSPEEAYRAAREGVGLRDASGGGWLRLQGKDALDLLHRLSTNDLLPLQQGQVAPTVLTNNKGRVIDHLKVYRLEDHLLVSTSPGNAQKVAEWIDLYTFIEESTVTDVTSETAVLQLLGPQAPPFVESLVGSEGPGIQRLVETRLAEIPVLIARDDALGVPAYDLVVPAEDANTLADWLLQQGQPWGLRAIGEEVFEALRIQAAMPLYGREISEKVNPLEAGLRPSISFTKGCYIGQEVVLRLDTYQKVQRHLVRLDLEGEGVPSEDESLMIGGKPAGTLTSVARVPGEGRVVGLGIVRAAYDQEGQQVEVVSDGRRWVGRLHRLEQYTREGTGS